MFRNRQTLLFLGDVIALTLSFYIMIAIRSSSYPGDGFIRLQTHLFVWLFILWMLIFFIFDLYNLRRVNPNPRNIGLIIMAMGVNIIAAIFIFYLFPQNGSPKTNLAVVGISTFFLLVIWRRVFYHLFTETISRKIGVIGNGPLVAQLHAEISSHPHLGIIVAIWENHTFIDTTENIDLLIADAITPEALLAISQRFETEVLSFLNTYKTLFAKIPLSLMTDESATEIIGRENNHGLILLYRLFESAIAISILVITSPILLLAIIAICIEDGFPVFYSQPRVGKNGKIFSIHKLRSMKKNAEANGAQWATKHDIRSTNIGRILRKLHIDEIPQMYNIIKGDLALVGPRPERPEFVNALEKEIPYYYLRHTINPGFTGWAQIKFRYASTLLDSQEKFEYDLYYIANKNPLLDIGIFLKTIQIIFTH